MTPAAWLPLLDQCRCHRSRIQSDGEVTISRDLAELVLLGDIDMAEAVRRQRAGG